MKIVKIINIHGSRILLPFPLPEETVPYFDSNVVFSIETTDTVEEIR